jgi:hypothetical protein
VLLRHPCRILQGNHGIIRALLFCREPAALIELLIGSQGPLLGSIAGHVSTDIENCTTSDTEK